MIRSFLARTPVASLSSTFHQFLNSMPPAYFAMVMATGILGIACELEKIPLLPQMLFAINLVTYILLWGLLILRAIYHRPAFLADFSSHQRGPGYFTLVAATSVLGSAFVIQADAPKLAHALWWFALLLWLTLTYIIFTALTVRDPKPGLEAGINGGWLTTIVATQSLVVLGAIVMPGVGAASENMMLALVSLWLAGGMLYIWLISLIFYRYTFFRFHPQDLTPPYWINMGAMAISTLAGTLLLTISQDSPLLVSLKPFLIGFTLFFWATATWWIPMLVILGVWRHVYSRIPLTYDPLYWGAVFPLAMYTTATFRLSEILQLPDLLFIPQLFVGLAITTWLLTFLGMVVTIVLALQRTFVRIKSTDC